MLKGKLSVAESCADGSRGKAARLDTCTDANGGGARVFIVPAGLDRESEDSCE